MLLPGEEGGLRVSAMRVLLQLGLAARNLAEHIEFRNTPPIPPPPPLRHVHLPTTGRVFQSCLMMTWTSSPSCPLSQ